MWLPSTVLLLLAVTSPLAALPSQEEDVVAMKRTRQIAQMILEAMKCGKVGCGNEESVQESFMKGVIGQAKDLNELATLTGGISEASRRVTEEVIKGLKEDELGPRIFGMKFPGTFRFPKTKGKKFPIPQQKQRKQLPRPQEKPGNQFPSIDDLNEIAEKFKQIPKASEEENEEAEEEEEEEEEE